MQNHSNYSSKNQQQKLNLQQVLVVAALWNELYDIDPIERGSVISQLTDFNEESINSLLFVRRNFSPKVEELFDSYKQSIPFNKTSREYATELVNEWKESNKSNLSRIIRYIAQHRLSDRVI